MTKLLLVLCALIVAVAAEVKTATTTPATTPAATPATTPAPLTDCYDNVYSICNVNTVTGKSEPLKLPSACNSKFGGLENNDALFKYITSYANLHIMKSIEHLLLASHFGSHEHQRPGFEKVFRELSDSTWEDAIKLIKYITKRGKSMEVDIGALDRNATYDHNEISSLSKALDIQKTLTMEGHKIHNDVSKAKNIYKPNIDPYDPNIAFFLEKEFLHQQTDRIRKLSGYITDVSHMLKHDNIKSVAMYLFDEYLQSQ